MIGLKTKTTANQVTSNEDTSGQDLFICLVQVFKILVVMLCLEAENVVRQGK